MTKRFSQVLFFLAFCVSMLLLGQSASSFTASGGYIDAVHIELESFEFDSSDVGTFIKSETVLAFAGQGGTQSDGLTEINRIIARDLTGLYPDVNPSDGNRTHERQNNGDCRTRFRLEDGELKLINMDIRGPTGSCRNVLDVSENADPVLYTFASSGSRIFNVERRLLFFEQLSDTQLKRVDEEPIGNQNKGLYTRDPNSATFPNRYFQDDGDEYVDVSTSSGGSNPANTASATYSETINSQSTFLVALLDANGNSTGVTPTLDPTLEAASETDDCNDQGGPFSFILCEIIVGVGRFIGVVDSQIESRLSINADYYEADQLQAIWGRIRNIAYILLIPTMLIMVISTALGFQFIDAYTVKRAMPRLLAAVIFMALSYDICVFLIEVVNNVGAGVKGIVAAPFGGVDNLTLESIFNPDNVDSVFTGAGLAVLGGITVVTAVSVGIIASYLLVAALVILIVFVLLAMRELIIVALIILAPLAILSWIFPGNDKPWKLWWGSFWKLLMLYPIIIGLLWLGRGFAKIVAEIGAEETGAIETAFLVLVKLVAYVGPFFFILAVFKWAGGAFANLSGIMNDRSKGLFDRQKKYRADKRAGIRKDMAASKRFRSLGQDSKINKALQTPFALSRVAEDNGGKAILDKGSRSAARKRLVAEGKKDAKDDYILNERMQNDIYAHALTIEDEKEREIYLRDNNYSGGDLARVQAEIDGFQRNYGSTNLAKMAIVAKAGSKTSYTNGIDEMLDDILRVTKGDATEAGSLLAQAGGAAQQGGVVHLSKGSFGDKFDAMMKRKGVINDATQMSLNGDQAGADRILRESSAEINAKQADKTIDSMNAYDYANLHPTAAKVMAQGWTTQMANTSDALRAAQDSGDQEKVAQLSRLLGQQSATFDNIKLHAASSGNAEAARILADTQAEGFAGGSIGFAGAGADLPGGGNTGVTFDSPDAAAQYVKDIKEQMRINDKLSRATNPDGTPDLTARAQIQPISDAQRAMVEGYDSLYSRGSGMTPEEMQRAQEQAQGGP